MKKDPLVQELLVEKWQKEPKRAGPLQWRNLPKKKSPELANSTNAFLIFLEIGVNVSSSDLF